MFRLRIARYTTEQLASMLLDPGQLALDISNAKLHVGDGEQAGGIAVGITEDAINALIENRLQDVSIDDTRVLKEALEGKADSTALTELPARLDGLVTVEFFDGFVADTLTRPTQQSVDDLAQLAATKAVEDATDDQLAELIDKDVLFQNGLIRAEHLPTSIDEVHEFASRAAFPAQGQRGMIYVANNDNTIYRWSGTQYIALASPEVLTVATSQETLPLVESKKALAPKPLGDVFTMLGFKEVTSGNWELDSGEVDMDIKVVTFFGEVNSSALIGGIDLATLCGLTAGTPFSTNQANDIWLKVGDPTDKKIKYISKLPLRYGISWDQLNARGLTTGREVTVKGKKYRVILPSGGSGSPTVVDMTSEWDRLFHALCVGRPTVYKGPVVANYSLAEMGFVTNRWNHCRDLLSGTTALSRGNPYSTRGSTPRNNTNGIFTWRPMLVEV